MRIWPVFLLFGHVFTVAQELQVTVVYDNTSTRTDLQAGWGFSAIVDVRGQRILFDPGSERGPFSENLQKLGIDKNSIQRTFISHKQPDHSSMVYRLLPAGLVYFLDGLSATPLAAPAQLGPGIYSSGEIPGSPAEQALVVETSRGLVMLVSCAHPGIGRMVETVEKQRNVRGIRMIIGGLHLYEQAEQQIRPVAAQLEKLNVQSLVLGHCTGDQAVRIFRERFGDRCATAGAGKRIALD